MLSTLSSEESPGHPHSVTKHSSEESQDGGTRTHEFPAPKAGGIAATLHLDMALSCGRFRFQSLDFFRFMRFFAGTPHDRSQAHFVAPCPTLPRRIVRLQSHSRSG